MSLLSNKIMLLLAQTALIAYLGFGVFGFFHTLHMTEMSIAIEDCPFIHVLHNDIENIAASTIQMIQPPAGVIVSFFGLALIVTALFAVTPLRFINYFFSHFLARTHKKNRRLRQIFYQHLFSNGILNPKLF